jgi:hypothetical protein
MTKKAAGGKRQTRKLKLKKETIKNLEPGSKADNIKGGQRPQVTTRSWTFGLACCHC